MNETGIVSDDLLSFDDLNETESSRCQYKTQHEVGRFFIKYKHMEEKQKWQLRANDMVNSQVPPFRSLLFLIRSPSAVFWIQTLP